MSKGIEIKDVCTAGYIFGISAALGAMAVETAFKVIDYISEKLDEKKHKEPQIPDFDIDYDDEDDYDVLSDLDYGSGYSDFYGEELDK